MVEVNAELVHQTAELANLELSEREVEMYTSQLREVLGYVDQLREVNVVASDGSEIVPLTHPLDLITPLRDDVVRPSPVDEEGQPKMLRPAPEVCDGSFKVPPIL